MMINKFFITSLLLYGAASPSLSAKEGKIGWGLSLGQGTASFRIGGRLQGVAEYNPTKGDQNLYMRRARVNLQYQTQNFHYIYMDLRNDNINRGDGGEGNLQIGDAFYEVPTNIPFITNLTLFRSKVDVSYSQTSSSKNLINPTRMRVSDYASNFVVHNRRATNAQINGGNSFLTYQLVVSDGIQSEEVQTLQTDTNLSSIAEQSLTLGGKVRFYLWNGESGKKAEVQDTYYGLGETFSLGIGYFQNPKIEYALTDGSRIERSRELTNFELSFAAFGFRLLGEAFYFKGDTLSIAQKRFGNSWGYYAMAEYVYKKWAPYFGFEYFERDETNDNSYERTQVIGLNYYAQKKLRRYGVSFRNYEFGNLLSDQDRREVMTYIMMDY